MNFQNLKNNAICRVFAVVLMFETYTAVRNESSVLGAEQILLALLIFGIALVLLAACTLYERFTKWVLKETKRED